MAGRRASRDAITREQWAAVIAASTGSDARREDGIRPAARRGRAPISRQRIVDAALGAIASIGYDRLTMRVVADALDTGPASLYAHVRNKAELGDLLIGELCSRIDLPEPDPAQWQEQFLDVCGQLRDQLLRYPGVAQAALAVVPADLTVLRVGEALLTFLLIGGVAPQEAAWTSDAAFLYVTAYCLEASVAERQGEDAQGEVIDRAEIAERLKMLPAEQFPNTVAFARELTAGEGHDRFDHTLRLMIRGQTSRTPSARPRLRGPKSSGGHLYATLRAIRKQLPLIHPFRNVVGGGYYPSMVFSKWRHVRDGGALSSVDRGAQPVVLPDWPHHVICDAAATRLGGSRW